MDLKESRNSDGRGCLTLHDDELLYLSKNYLKEQDCFSLAMSGASDNYTSLYTANRKRLAIGRNSYHLTPTSWADFFKECISPQSITTFDASHTYWLPAEVLMHSIVQMTNLEELCVHDTQICLSHVPKIFKNCPKLVKLTFTLKEKTVIEAEIEKASLKLLKNGFARLTQLKIFNFAPDDGNERSIQSWLNLFQVLKWCQDCVVLVAKFAPSEKGESGFTTTTLEEDKLLDEIVAELFPHLIWMKNLKSLAILNNHHNRINMGFPILTRLLGLLLPRHKCLERLWISDDFVNGKLTGDSSSGPPFLKSLEYRTTHFDAMDACDDFEDERFALMEHVADVPFQDFGHLPHLKHVQGFFNLHDVERFNDFCRSVPNLEYLHVCRTALYFYEEKLEGDWSLPLLKVLNFLEFERSTKSEEFIQQLIQRCPNIEELVCQRIPIDCFSEMSFKHLKRLNICLSDDETYLPTIFEQCPKLEILHLSGHGLLPKVHFNQLSLCLPAAANLRDLLLCCKICDERDITLLVDLMRALLTTAKSSNLKYFERLVVNVWDDEDDHLRDIAHHKMQYKEDDFYYDIYFPVNDKPLVKCTKLEEFIVEFAKGMTHLVCLGIFGFRIDPSAAEMIQRRIAEEVVPLRPAFWYHLGRKLPNESDVSVPRIHLEEIVNQNNLSAVPPDILNLK